MTNFVGIKCNYINSDREVLPYFLEEDLYEAIQEMWNMYNPLTGPIQNITTYYGVRGGCPIYTGHTEYYDSDYLFKKIMELPSVSAKLRGTIFGGGKGFILSSMVIASIAETIERVLGSFAFFEVRDKLLYGTYSSLISQGVKCVSPEEIPLFAKEQYTEDFIYKPFTSNSFLGWIKGRKLISGEEVYYPAQLGLMLCFVHPKEEIIGYATSGGLSCHINLYEAIYHAITELIERDAVNLRWICKIPPQRIKISKEQISSPILRNLLEISESSWEKINFYYHSMDIKEVSVITAIEIDKWFKKYAYYPGGGADINIESSLMKSLAEYTQAERNLKLALLIPQRRYSTAVSRMFEVPEDVPIEKLNIFFKVVSLYGYKKNLDKLKWYLEGEEIPLDSIKSNDIKNPEERYKFILKVMERYKIDPIFFDFTPKFFKKIKLIKICIPELALPHLPSYPYFGHPRYYEIPKKLGYTNKRLTFKDLMKEPLPYP